MNKTLAAFALTLLAAASALADIHGAWTAESEGSGRMHINLTRHDNNFGETMNVADFTGLSAATLDAVTQTPVKFELRREAGTIALEGTFKNGDGAGQFTFTPNPSYASTLRTLGVTFDDDKEWTDSRLMEMAVLDVSTDYIRSMQAEGFHETGNKYVEMRIFKVTPEYVRAMRAAGYPDLTAQQLVESRIHKATPEFASAMAALGYDHVPFRQLVEFRIFKVTPELLRDLKAEGYDHIPAQRLVEMRIHGVTPEFIRELKDAGYEHVPVEKLVEMKIHGITPDYIKRMNGSK